MNFKQGMIGITPKDGRHFINYNVASALVCLDIHGGQQYFPSSPFAYTSARALKKQYRIERVSIGSGPDGVEQLTAVPRDSAAAAFSATLWLVPRSSTVRALELWCVDCPKHPIIPLFDDGRIDTADFRYKQTWSTTGPPMPEVIQVDYGVAYSGPDFHERYTSSAVVHAFDRGQPFLPTVFPWKKGVNEYPMISWMPRDTAFWNRMSPPVPTERQQRDRAILLGKDVTQNTWYDSLRLEYPHIQPHYVAWSKDRCIDHTHFSGAPEDRPNDGREPPLVQMRTHLYLDLDTTGGVLHHRTLAVLDSKSSWYLHNWEPWASAYCTLLFDLCEIERRALERRLNEPGMTLARAMQLHKEHTQRMKDEQKRLYLNVENKVIQLRTWNVQVREELGVDRFRDANVGPPGSFIEP
jgi:hypothetical protein